jgi:hypothetical protein
MVTLAWVLGVSLGVSFLCSVLEAVLLSVNHSYVALLKEEGRRAGDFLERMQARIDEPISAILTLNTIAHTVGCGDGRWVRAPGLRRAVDRALLGRADARDPAVLGDRPEDPGRHLLARARGAHRVRAAGPGLGHEAHPHSLSRCSPG